ncbi:MAG: DUF4440 domain-containing protein [Bdellovibrionota bacterium]
MNDELKKRIIELEVELHQQEVRRDLPSLDSLLAEGFLEIGASGKFYTKKDILSRLPSEVGPEIKSYDFEVREIQVGVIQILYKTDTFGKKVFRNSIWISEKGRWEMIFHQGTELA